MQITRRHHDNGYRGLNNRTNFYADIKSVIQRADQHQHPRAGQIQRGMRDIIIGDRKGKTNTGIN